MRPIIFTSLDASELGRSEIEKMELFGRVDTASIHPVVSLMVENVVVRLFEVNEYCTKM
jgi:hypothetical protein